jgi:hypothetical protein
MKKRTETLGQLIKQMDAMGGAVAPKSATLFEMLGKRLQLLEEEVARISEKCELKAESFNLVYDAETRLSQLLNDLRNSNFLRAGDIRDIVKTELDKADFALNVDWKERAEIFLTGMIGGITAFIGMVVIYG